MLNRTIAMGWLFLSAPRAAAERARRPESLAPCAALYAAFLLGNLFFYWLKPFDFPDPAALPPPRPEWWFWTKVMLFWQPPFELLSITLLMGLIVWFSTGSLGLRLAAGVLWAALPFIILVSYGQTPGASRAAFALGALACFAPFPWLLRKTTREQFLPVLAFMLGISALGLVQLALMTLATAAGSVAFFKGAQAGVGFWLLGVGTVGIRAITGLRLARAFLSLFLSMFFLIAAAFTLHLLGVPPEILKAALLYG